MVEYKEYKAKVIMLDIHKSIRHKVHMYERSAVLALIFLQ